MLTLQWDQADLDVIKHLLTSSVKDSCVVLTLFSKGRKQRYDCQLLRDTWTSELFNWQYVVKDEYAGQPLLANAAIVNVLEDMRLRLLQSSGGRKDLLSLDDEDIGGTSLGFRIEWDPNASAIMSLIISHVTGGGCAHQLQVGDAIVAVDGWRVLECSKDEVISLLRGDAIVGSTCNLVVNRRGELLQVQVCRTRSAQVRDANTLQQLCAELQQTASNASSAEHVVQQLMEHSITMEKRRCQRERLMANALRELQAFLTDGIDLALCNLKPPKSEPPKIEQHPRVLDVGDVDVYAWQRLKKLVESQSRFTLHELVCAMDESALGIETLMHLLLHLERGKGVDWSNIVEMFQLFNTSKGYSSAKQAIQVLKQHKSQPRQHHDYDPEILAAKLDSRVLHDGFSGRNTQKELENKLKEVEASLKMSQEITRRLEQELAKVKDFFRQLIEDQSSQILLLQQQLAHSVPTHLYEKMEQALAALAAENDQLKERRADTSELHLLQQQLASAEQGCNDATMHTQHYKQEMIELQSQLSNARMSTAVLEHNIKDLESKLQDMGATLRDTAGKLKDVEATFNDSQANHREIEAKLLAMQKDADELLVNLEHLLHNLPQEVLACKTLDASISWSYVVLH